MMIQDFKSILDLPMVTFVLRFKLEKEENEIGIMPRIKEILSPLEQRIRVQELSIGLKNQENILEILPFLDSETLEVLQNGRDVPTGEVPPHSIRSLELDSFPNLNSLALENLTGILPLESWWNIRSVYLKIKIDENCSPTESLEQLPRIIQHFRQTPTLYEWSIFLNSSDADIKNAIGDTVQWEVIRGQMGGSRETFRLPADGSNFNLDCQVGHGYIDFFRTVQTGFWF